MELFNQLVELAEPLAYAAVVAAVAFGLSKLDKIAKASENKWDDKLVAAFKEGLAEGLKATPSEQVAAVKAPAEESKAE